MSYAGWIGIDPGKDGAAARVWADGSVRVIDVPTVEAVSGSGKKKKMKMVYDRPAMAAVLSALVGDDPPGSVLVCLERVHAGAFYAMKQKGHQMGLVSAFSMGNGLGIWQGAVAMAGLAILEPDPVTWKKVIFADGPKNKEAAIPLAAGLYPRARAELRGPRGGLEIGRADAILLAHYARIRGDSAVFDGSEEI
jgi:hypothetical protein